MNINPFFGTMCLFLMHFCLKNRHLLRISQSEGGLHRFGNAKWVWGCSELNRMLVGCRAVRTDPAPAADAVRASIVADAKGKK
jgi:hypothetical protein